MNPPPVPAPDGQDLELDLSFVAPRSADLGGVRRPDLASMPSDTIPFEGDR